MRPNAYVLLDGVWRFELDLDDRGMREGWHLGHPFSAEASWPSTIESQLAAAAMRPDRIVDEVVAWYERDVEIPTEWLRPDTDVQVTFGACGYETRVWLDGLALRTVEGEEVHLGEYTSFSYELPSAHLTKPCRLTVRVADSLDPDTPRGKQESRVYKRGGIWYQTISGPVRSIWLEPVERNRLRSRLGVVSSVRDRLVELRFTTHVHDPGRYHLRAQVTEVDGSPPIAEAELALPLEAGQHRQHLALELPDARPWTPDTPFLYRVTAQLAGPTGEESHIEARFGMREVEARGRSLYLNGERLYLDGILYQPGPFSYEEIRRHMLAIKKLGCNLVRVHIAGIDPRLYQLADELGLLLWVEVPSPHRSSARSRELHAAELERMLLQIGAGPSVVILSLFNEDWGIEDVATSVEASTYVRDTYARLRLEEPQLLVVDNDGWQHLSREGRLQTDLMTAHVYRDTLGPWRGALDALVDGQLTGVTPRPLVVGDPFRSVGQRPLVISEWGGFGFPAYGGPTARGARARRIRSFKRELRRRRIAGDVYTQAVSIEDEVNGLIDPVTFELLVPPGLLRSAAPVDDGRARQPVRPALEPHDAEGETPP